MDKDILRKVKFTIAPKTCEDGKSIILMNNNNENCDKTFNILTNLFYYIKETVKNYN